MWCLRANIIQNIHGGFKPRATVYLWKTTKGECRSRTSNGRHVAGNGIVVPEDSQMWARRPSLPSASLREPQ